MGIVYSTEVGAVCPGCGKSKKSCVCHKLKKAVVPETSAGVRVRYETTGKGKGMTLITGLVLNEDNLLVLAKKLKQQLATGGAVKDFVIELQGDQRERVTLALRKLGYLG